MEALISLFAVMAVIGSIIAVWLNTKSGKKWLANLQCTSHWNLRLLWMHQVLVWQQKVVGWSVLSDAISHANRVITLGLLHSAVSAQQFAFRLNKFGVDAHAISDYTIMASYERILKSGDVVVIFSISGRDTYISLAEEYRKTR